MFRQLEHARVAVEEMLIIHLKHAGAGQAAIAPQAHQPARHVNRQRQRGSADDAIAHVEPRELDDFGRHSVELIGCPGIAIPVQHQVGGQDTPSGYRSICVTEDKTPASRRKRTRPRWNKVARNPPPDRANPIRLRLPSEIIESCLTRTNATLAQSRTYFFFDDLFDFFLGGTFPPFFRAFDKPMAIACLRLCALLFLPLRCVPFFVLLTAFFTSRFAVEPYFAIGGSPKNGSALPSSFVGACRPERVVPPLMPEAE